MLRNAVILFLACLAAVSAQVPLGGGSGRAEWLAASTHCPPGGTLDTAVRLKLRPGWHTYWVNPGESGMPIEVKWQLPDGWRAGEVAFPAPGRFMTGQLHHFGYDGTLCLPVTLTAPAGFAGTAEPRLQISWLACNDSACVPGEAGLRLSITAGPPQPSEHASAIQQAKHSIPERWDDRAKLSVHADGKKLELTITPVPGSPADWDGFEVFPAIQRTLDPRTAVRFTRDGGVWRTVAPLDEYAAPPLRDLHLVFSAGAGKPSRLLTWSAIR